MLLLDKRRVTQRNFFYKKTIHILDDTYKHTHVYTYFLEKNIRILTIIFTLSIYLIKEHL